MYPGKVREIQKWAVKSENFVNFRNGREKVRENELGFLQRLKVRKGRKKKRKCEVNSRIRTRSKKTKTQKTTSCRARRIEHKDKNATT